MLPLQVDERRAPLRTWANASGPVDHWQSMEVDEPRMAPVRMELGGRWVCCHAHLFTLYSQDRLLNLHDAYVVSATPDVKKYIFYYFFSFFLSLPHFIAFCSNLCSVVVCFFFFFAG